MIRKLVKLEKKDVHMTHKVMVQCSKLDLDRDVCRAFVIFNKAEYKEYIIFQYRHSKNFVQRLCQKRHKWFEGYRLRVRCIRT